MSGFCSSPAAAKLNKPLPRMHKNRRTKFPFVRLYLTGAIAEYYLIMIGVRVGVGGWKISVGSKWKRGVGVLVGREGIWSVGVEVGSSCGGSSVLVGTVR